jgi:methylmalonyl-CoA/ethylmalonyl-CoA epimerase
MAPTFLGLEHLGLVVEDLDQACVTFGEQLGFPVQGREELPARGVRVAFVDTGSTRIEILAPTRPDSEVSSFLAKRGEGLHHIAVRVADLDMALDALKKRGVRLINETPQPGAHDTRVAFVHPKAAHGVLLELVELGTDVTTHSTGDHHA